VAVGPGPLAEKLQSSLVDARELAMKPPVLALDLGGAVVKLVGEVDALERVGLQVVYLPLSGRLPSAS
jgi:hypothetical protein